MRDSRRTKRVGAPDKPGLPRRKGFRSMNAGSWDSWCPWVPAFAAAVVSGAGCARMEAQSATARDVVGVRIRKSGEALLGGESAGFPELLAALRSAAERRSGDAEAGVGSGVEFAVHPDCEWQHVRTALVSCIRAGIRRVCLETGGERAEIGLPLVIVRIGATPSTPLPEDMWWDERDERELELEYPESMAKPTVAEETKPVRRPVILRVYWRNSRGARIYSPTQAFADGLFENVLDTQGAQVVCALGLERHTNWALLSQSIAERSSKVPQTRFFLLAWDTVPFRNVFAVVRACLDAGVGSPKLMPPPIFKDDEEATWRWWRIARPENLRPEWR